jgi:hypothetical protein
VERVPELKGLALYLLPRQKLSSVVYCALFVEEGLEKLVIKAGLSCAVGGVAVWGLLIGVIFNACLRPEGLASSIEHKVTLFQVNLIKKYVL